MVIKFRTADLFAGIGGIRMGFEKAGFETAFAADLDKNCKLTYDANFSTVPLSIADVRKIQAKDLPEFEILLGGFPCQPFSVAGKKKGFQDEGRGDLFFHILNLVKQKKPAAIFLENVKHLKTHDEEKTFALIVSKLEEAGYRVRAEVLNSAEYGNVPQNRERLYIVAFKSEGAFNSFRFPGRIDPLTKSIEDCLDEEVDSKYYYTPHQGTWLYERIKDQVKDRGFVYQWRRVYLRKNNNKGLCYTLTANMGMGGHNVPIIKDHKGIRRLTPKECSRLQGFRENYVFPKGVADGQLYKQIGNTVTVPVIYRIARNIKMALEEDLMNKKTERVNVARSRKKQTARASRFQVSAA